VSKEAIAVATYEPDNRRTFAWKAALLLGGACVACLAIAGLVAVVRPHGFETYNETIKSALMERGLLVKSVQVSRTQSDIVHYPPYHADVYVQIQGEREFRGRLICDDGDRKCVFNVSRLGIAEQPIPDLVPPPRWPWLGWLQHHLPHLPRRSS
jgi:hypothetical protein